jgi:Flp pilus assembly protein TadD
MPAYCDLARVRLKQRNVDGAVSVLEAGLKISPQDPVLLNNVGICQMTRGDHQKALEFFTQAAAINPNNPRYRANMAAALGMLGRYEESLALYRQVVPKEAAQQNLGVLRDARGKASGVNGDMSAY